MRIGTFVSVVLKRPFIGLGATRSPVCDRDKTSKVLPTQELTGLVTGTQCFPSNLRKRLPEVHRGS